jgi:hypothetical protein
MTTVHRRAKPQIYLHFQSLRPEVQGFSERKKFAGESPETTGVIEHVTAAFVRYDSFSA